MDHVALAHAAYDAIEAGEPARFRALLSDDCAVWYCFRSEVKPADALAHDLAGLHAAVHDLRYDDRRYHALPDGAVLQHVLRGTTPDGTAFAVHFMTRLHVDGDGRIRWIEDYVDPAQIAVVNDAITASGTELWSTAVDAAQE